MKNFNNKKIYYFLAIFIFALLIFLLSKITLNFFSKSILKKNYYNFVKEKINKVHHIRSMNSKICQNNRNLDCFLFTQLDELKQFDQKVIFNGDSWAEQILTHQKLNENKNNNKIFALGNELKMNFILSGVSSYSPSLMLAQYNLLVDEYKIIPKYIISIFDQSDFGDELCRYKELRYKKNNKIYVKNYSDNKYINDPFNYIRDMELANIFYSESLDIVKVFKIGYLKIKQRFQKKIIKKCPYKNISAKIKNKLSKNEEDYIINIINEYIDTVFQNDNLEKLFIVTHPHKQNLTGYYENDISVIVKKAIENNMNKNNIKLINFEHNYFNLSDFINEDPSSHLKDNSYEKYLNRIFNEFKMEVKK